MTRPTSTTLSLAGRVRQVRLLRGLTQSDVAARAGLSRATYQRFERVGVLGLDGFVRVLECLGLGHQLAALGTDDAAAIAAAYALRQRGRRRARSATEPAPKPDDTPPAAGRSESSRAPNAAAAAAGSDASAAGASPPDPAAIARAATEHRRLIGALVRSIVWNRLTNHTAGPAVSTMLRGERGLDDAAKKGIVAALESELRRLNPDNVAEFSIGLPEFQAWQPTWKPDAPIARALE